MDVISSLSRLPSVRHIILGCLALQVTVGALIASEGVWDWWRQLPHRTSEPIPTAPIEPGHQTRPFVPVSVPRLEDPTRRLSSPIRLPEVLPSRLTFEVQTTADHGRVLLVAGPVESGDARRFESFLRDVVPAPDFVAFQSPGGLVAEALRIGRTIRAEQLGTLISADAACLSSCPYMLAGGVVRRVSRAGWVGLHQHYHSEDTILPAVLAVQGVQTGQGETLEYLDEMGIDPRVLVHVLKTPPEDIYLMVEDELIDYALATELID